MIDRLRQFLTPAHAACLAALLAVIGVEMSDETLRMFIEGAAAIVAVIGFFLRATAAPPAEPPLHEPPNRQRT